MLPGIPLTITFTRLIFPSFGCYAGFLPNPDKPEPKMINHENTKFGKHEIFLFFRVFFLSCFRDKKVFS
jgi:hypothetical protein